MFDRVRLFASRLFGKKDYGVAAGTGGDTAAADLKDSMPMAALYGKLAILYAGVYAIANTAASVPLRVHRKRRNGDLEELPDHPLQKLLDRPNPFTSAYELREETFAFMALLGNHYWYLEGGEQLQIPTEIAPIKPWRIQPIPDPQTFVAGYILGGTNGAKEQRLDPYSIVHHRAFNPTSDNIGQGAVQPAADAAIADIYAQLFNKKFFVNGATLQGVLTSKQPMTEDLADRIAKKFNADHKGLANAWKWRVLGGGLEPKSMQPTHTDMEFKELRKMSREEILVALGVPPVKVGLLDGATYANAKEQDKSFWQGTILPKLIRFEDVLNRDLAIRYGPDIVLKHDLSDVEALKDQVDMIATNGEIFLRNGAISPNEWREWINTRRMPVLDPIPDPHGDTFYLPLSQLPATGDLADNAGDGAADSEATPPAEEGDQDAESSAGASPARRSGQGGGRSLLRRAATRSRSGRVKDLDPPAQPKAWDQVAAAISKAETLARKVLVDTKDQDAKERRVVQWRAFEQKRRSHERAFRVSARAVFKKQQTGVLEVLPAALESLGVKSLPTGLGWHRARAWAAEILEHAMARALEHGILNGDGQETRDPVGDADAISKLPESIRQVFQKLAVENADRYRKTYRGTIEQAGKDTLVGLEVGTPFSLITVETLSFLEQNGARLVKNTDLVTQKQIALEIAKGITDGDNVLGISDRVREVFSQAGRVRANAIARTESVKSYNFGTMEGYRQSGVVESKEWLTAEDADVRGNDPQDDFDHVSADGQVVPIGASFTVSGEMLDFPGDPAGSAGNVINCRCTVLPRVTGEAEE